MDIVYNKFMKRRNFIFTTIFSLFTYKAFAHSFFRVKRKSGNNFLISSADNTCVTLKSGMTYKLPENPTDIDSIINFRVQKSKWSKSPVIDPTNRRIASKNGLFDVEKNVNLDESRNFTLQYVCEDMGWIVLS